jgi:GT2 family glycosyltransferase
MPSLSVVIPSHNRPDLLRLCLESVRRHAPRDTEVLVVDDASPDEAVSRVAAEFASVRCLRLPRHSGFCVAANAGINETRADIVELLNDDTEVCSGWAEAALACFEDPAVAAVAPLVLRWPGDGPRGPIVDSAGDRYFVGGIAGKRGHGRPLGPLRLCRRQVFGASGSSAFYRRAAFLAVGGFPEDFGAYFEDVDLACRLNRAGWKVVYEPAARVLHRVGASHRRCPRLLRQQSRNEERVFWRNTPARCLAHAVPLHFAVLLGKAWRRWREGTLTPFLRGRLDVLAEAPAIVRHRRRLAGVKR